ncbi:SMC-Scp complex subunit ScpB [Micromonospora sp. URMC 103]|uniref:SMC-Scp complex subunit ScpB n=1 Tax=Micromonospora sp. URMC 103 TaxID=3423406 RepID=UPI003F1B2F4D
MSNDEERRDSLAEQAAAWVPPWERPAPPAAPSPGDLDATRPDEPPATPGDAPLREPESTGPSGESDAVVEAGERDAVAGPGEPDAVAGAGQESDPVAEATVPAQPGSAAEAGPAAGAPEEPAAGVPPKVPARRRRAPEPAAPPPELDDAELRGALEAILLVVDEPVSEATLAEVLEQPAGRIASALAEIAAGYGAAGHGFELRRAAGGWRLYTRPEYAAYVERFVLDGQSVRLTQAALETLAVVAYKQPVTRSRISAIRGVNCDGVIRTLVTRGLVEECGTEPESGAFLYRTTTLFLEKLGLDTVGELPPLAPFLPDDVEELTDATR